MLWAWQRMRRRPCPEGCGQKICSRSPCRTAHNAYLQATNQQAMGQVAGTVIAGCHLSLTMSCAQLWPSLTADKRVG